MGASSLPPKEAKLFKLILKSHETKQYKKALKAAETILKKFQNHGETLSMKGLTLNCMGRKQEAYELVRLGLKNDLKSHVSWHVYGLLYRSDREYKEAIKCYRNALRINPDNIEVLRDLSLLQAQMRDLAGFVETRQQLLTLKPNDRMNWIGFAVSHHLNSNASKAIDILEAYEGTLEEDYPPESKRYEHGEMLLYKVSLLKECGLFEKALQELRRKEFKIVDKLAYKEEEVSLLVKLNNIQEGEKLYRELLTLNPDNYSYHEGLQRCLGLYSETGQYSSEEIDKLDALYKSLWKQYTWSSAVKRIPLDFLDGDKFLNAADDYVRHHLTQGVPSLFSDLSPLYDHANKAGILEKLVLGLEDSLKKTGGFPKRSEKESPSTLMWTLFYLAQHYDRRAQYDMALAKIEEAMQHTPTVIDLYSVKSKILKHAGDFVAAAALADEARSMDLADRYVNSQCVKRMLQADQVPLAEKTAVLFTKDGEQHNNLQDMHCMWYEIASGESYARQDDLGRALKSYLTVEKHYADITQDQFDFHSYCSRKMTLRSYIEMLRFQDQLHAHADFRKAAAGAIRCYIKIYDSPQKSSTKEDEEMAKLPASQKKKLRQKQRKAAKKEADVKSEEANAGNVSKFGKKNVKAVDTDPNGEKLLQIEDPLMEAGKYLKLLQKHSSEYLETQLLSFEVNMRKQKILLALLALKHLVQLDAENPDTHRCLIRFFHKVASMSAPTTDAEKLISGVVEAERPTFSQLRNKSLMKANTAFLEQHKDSLMHRAAVAEMIFCLEPNKKAEAIKLIEESSNNPVSSNGALGSVKEWKLGDCVAVHKLLVATLDDRDAALRWKNRCAEEFPYSTYFEGSLCSSKASKQIHENAENGSIELPSPNVIEEVIAAHLPEDVEVQLPLSVQEVLIVDDLLEEILSRLPIVSSALFKTVSKRWTSLIRSSNLRRKNLKKIDSCVGFFVAGEDCRRHPNYHFVSCDQRFRYKSGIQFETPAGENALILGSSNGLLVCSCLLDKTKKLAKKLAILNPTENLFKMLPNPYQQKEITFCRLEYNPLKSDHYQVLIATRYGRSFYRIQVYSSETGMWSLVCKTQKLSEEYKNWEFEEESIYMDSAIYWIHKDTTLCKAVFVSGTINVNRMQIPFNVAINYRLLESRGFLVLLDIDLNVYVMRNDQWQLKYCVDNQVYGTVWLINLAEKEEDSFMVLREEELDDFPVDDCSPFHYKAILYRFLEKTSRQLFLGGDLQEPGGPMNSYRDSYVVTPCSGGV